MLTVLYRAASIGLLEGLALEALDEDAMRRALERVRARGVAGRATHDLARALDEDVDPASIARAWHDVADALEESPLPDAEWDAALALFGPDELAELVGVSPASLRRYAAGARATPQDIAERLHVLTLTAGDLRGTYNDYGIRRWFQRRHHALENRSPKELFSGKWDPDGADARRVRELAAGSGAFVAT